LNQNNSNFTTVGLNFYESVFNRFSTLVADINKLLVTSKLSQYDFWEKDTPLRILGYGLTKVTSSKLANEKFLRAQVLTSNIWPSQLMQSLSTLVVVIHAILRQDLLPQKRRALFIFTSFFNIALQWLNT
jgi:hypothetical protein